jgi:hypothetical protein
MTTVLRRNFEKGRGREGTSDFTFPAENDFIKEGSCIPDAAASGKMLLGSKAKAGAKLDFMFV